MKKHAKSGTGLSGFRTATCLLLAFLISAAGIICRSRTESLQEYRIEDITGQTQEILAMAAIDKLNLRDKLGDINIRRNGQIRGRGISDEPSGSEPDYFGLVGYAAVANDGSMSLGEDSLMVPWMIPTYQRYDNKWYITRSIAHKTGVLVIGQGLGEISGGRYKGRLQVIRLDCNEICFINVENFVTAPYWFYTPGRAQRYGSVIAVYRPVSGQDPKDPDGKGYPLDAETRILIPGAASWDQRAPSRSNVIPGIAYEETAYGFTSSVLFFPEEDLTLIY